MCNEHHALNVIYYTILSCSILSALSSLILIFSYLKYKNLRSLSMKIVFMININDLIRNVAFMVPFEYLSNRFICIIYGFVINVSFVNNSVWAIYLSFSLHRIMLTYDGNPKTYYNYVLCFVFILVPLLNIAPIFTDSYGTNKGICTLKEYGPAIIWRYTEIGIEILATLLSVIIYLKIYLKARKFEVFTISDLIFQRGMIFAIIAMIISVVACTIRFFEFRYTLCDLYIYFIFYYVLISSQGLFNFLGILANKSIRSALKKNLTEETCEDSLFEIK